MDHRARDAGETQGRIRWALAALVASLLLASCTTIPAPAPIAELPFERRDDGRVVVDVMLDGRGPYPFVLDTGAGATLLDPELVDELGLTPESFNVTIRTVDGVTTATAFTGVVVGLGGAETQPLWVVSFDRPETIARGILGMDVLAGHVVEIDGHDAVVRLYESGYRPPPSANVSRAPLVLGVGGLPHANVRVNDRPGLALIDTGMAGVIIDPAYASRARLHTRRDNSRLVDIASVNSRIRRSGDAKLRLDATEWRIEEAALYRPAILDYLDAGRPTDLILGARVFASVSLVIDTPGRELLIVHKTRPLRRADGVLPPGVVRY